MKIGWTNLLPEETKSVIGLDFSGVWDGFRKYFEKITAPRSETKIQIYFPEKSTWTVHFPYIEFLNNRWFVEAGYQAEQDGCDAVIVGAATDTGLQYLKELLNIPVVGITESAMHLSCMLGAKFAGITVFRRLIPPKANLVRFYGLESRAIANPLRSCDLTGEDIGGLFDKNVMESSIWPKFEAVARQCIDEGAEVIICDDAWLAPALSYFGYFWVRTRRSGVPGGIIGTESPKLAQALFEVLPRDTEDWRLTSNLLGERETLGGVCQCLCLGGGFRVWYSDCP
jgi:allantoin racemase